MYIPTYAILNAIRFRQRSLRTNGGRSLPQCVHSTKSMLSLALKRRSSKYAHESSHLQAVSRATVPSLLSCARPVLALVLRVLPRRVHPTTVTMVLSLPRTDQTTPSTAPHLIVWSTRGSSGTGNLLRIPRTSNAPRVAVLGSRDPQTCGLGEVPFGPCVCRMPP